MIIIQSKGSNVFKLARKSTKNSSLKLCHLFKNGHWKFIQNLRMRSVKNMELLEDGTIHRTSRACFSDRVVSQCIDNLIKLSMPKYINPNVVA